jgi:hypothetical protein
MQKLTKQEMKSVKGGFPMGCRMIHMHCTSWARRFPQWPNEYYDCMDYYGCI